MMSNNREGGREVPEKMAMSGKNKKAPAVIAEAFTNILLGKFYWLTTQTFTVAVTCACRRIGTS